MLLSESKKKKFFKIVDFFSTFSALLYSITKVQGECFPAQC